MFALYFLLLHGCAVAVRASRANCSSFTTNGTAVSQFNYYRFYDFQNLAPDTWNETLRASDPNNVTAGASTSDMSWQLDWSRRDGLRYPSPGMMVLPIDYQPDKVAIRNVTNDAGEIAGTALGFVTSRQSETSHQSSGIDFNQDSILHMSLRLRARISGASGACAAFFTHVNDTQEADIELLTRNSGDIVGFNTQPTLDVHGNHIEGATWNRTLPNNLTRGDWVTYRMDWVARQIVWYVDGVQMVNTSVNVPVEPSHLYITMWGNGGTWTGNMTLGDSALLEVQWLEVAYNISGASPARTQNATVCDIDDPDEERNIWHPDDLPPPHVPPSSTSDGQILYIDLVYIVLAIIIAVQ